MTPENLAGLVVGEGCFYTESAADPKYRLGWRIRPAFCIEMRRDDEPVLDAARSLLECGAIYHLDFGRYRGYATAGWQPHAKFRVTRLEDLHYKVIPFFRRHQLFGRKQRSFCIFSEIVEGLAARDHLDPAGLQRLKRLAHLLSLHNQRGTHGAHHPLPS